MATAAASRTERRQRREDVRAKLVEAIGELAAESAFRDLTVDVIARRAGLSRSAFYFYFRDKHDLLIAAAAEVADDLYVEADCWWHGQGEPGALVREALTGVASVYARHGRLLGLAVEVSTYDPDVRAFWRSLVERFVDATAEHLERERVAGRVGSLDPRGTAESLVWMAERCFWLFLASSERSVAEVVDQLAAVWMAAIYAERAGDGA
ncbi:MAG: TetR/AcrR family transcriptional regulator [Thermoleophilaceae bacterium]